MPKDAPCLENEIFDIKINKNSDIGVVLGPNVLLWTELLSLVDGKEPGLKNIFWTTGVQEQGSKVLSLFPLHARKVRLVISWVRLWYIQMSQQFCIQQAQMNKIETLADAF
jgi:hypothetical protein